MSPRSVYGHSNSVHLWLSGRVHVGTAVSKHKLLLVNTTFKGILQGLYRPLIVETPPF